MKEYNRAEEKFQKDGTPNTSQISRLSLRELDDRKSEMISCVGVDFGEDGVRDYLNAIDWFKLIQCDRAMNFLAKHKLVDKFEDEDAARTAALARGSN